MNVIIMAVVIVVLSSLVGLLTSDYDMHGLKYNWYSYRYYKSVALSKGVKTKTVRRLADVNRVAQIIPLIVLGATGIILVLSLFFGKEEITPVSITAPKRVELIEQQNNETCFYVSRKNDFFEMLYLDSEGKVTAERVPIGDCSVINDGGNYVIIREREQSAQLKWFILKSLKRKRVEKNYEIHINIGIYDQRAGQ